MSQAGLSQFTSMRIAEEIVQDEFGVLVKKPLLASGVKDNPILSTAHILWLVEPFHGINPTVTKYLLLEWLSGVFRLYTGVQCSRC
jgi:hypothetical protein